MRKCTDEEIKKNVEFMLNDITVDGVPGNVVFMAGRVDHGSRPTKCEVIYRYGPCRKKVQVIGIDESCRPIKDYHKIRVIKERLVHLVRSLPSYLKGDLYKIFFLMSSKCPEDAQARAEELREFIDCLDSFFSVIFQSRFPAVFPDDFMRFFLERSLWDPKLPDDYVSKQIQNAYTYRVSIKVLPVVWKIRFIIAKIYEAVHECLEMEVPNEVLKLFDKGEELSFEDGDWQLFNLSSISTEPSFLIDNFIVLKVIWATGSVGISRIKSILKGVELYF